MRIDPTVLSATGRVLRRVATATLRDAAAPPWRARLRQLSRDETPAAATRPVLVVVAHGADLTTGAGALLARKRASGTAVDVLVVGDGRHAQRSRYLAPTDLADLARRETLAAAAMLGIDGEHVHFLGIEQGRLAAAVDEIAAAVFKRLVDLGPDDVLLPADDDGDADRAAVHGAVRVAVSADLRPPRLLVAPTERWVRGPLAIDGTPPMEGLDARSVATGRVPTLVRVDTERFEFLKRAAFDLHRSLHENLTDERSWTVRPPGWLDPLAAPCELFVVLDGATVPAATLSSGTIAHLSGRKVIFPAPVDAPPPVASVTPITPTLVVDRFLDDRLPGAVIGSSTPEGVTRRGVDVEGRIGVDHGEARFTPLAEPGFGRQGLAYGPFERRPGRALVVVFRHSHQNAHVDLSRLGRRAMLIRAARTFPRVRLLPQVPTENLVVGFAPDSTVADPGTGGHLFSIAPLGPVNGELAVRVPGGRVVVEQGVQELPLCLVVRLGTDGATFYAASLPGVPGLAPAPHLRPVAVARNTPGASASPDVEVPQRLFAGIWQAVHGEAGHQLASRISSVRVVDIADWADPRGATLLHDPLTGDGAVPWPVLSGALERTAAGTRGGAFGGRAIVELAEPAGLVAVTVATEVGFVTGGAVELCLRASADGRRMWRLRLETDNAWLELHDQDRVEVVAAGPAHVPSAARCLVQVLDDGAHLRVNLDGNELFDGVIEDDRLAGLCGVGIGISAGTAAALRDLEIHPRVVDSPAALRVEPLWDEQGGTEAWTETFAGAPGPLGATSLVSGRHWERVVGPGVFDVAGGPVPAVLVRADRQRPNLDRTVYATAWHDPSFADLDVCILPPGRARSQGEGCRGGLCFFQDADNYVVLNLWIDDSPNHNGSAVSMFVRIRGDELATDAPWTNIGRMATWGRPVRLRASTDGDHVVVWLDGRAVLFRRLTDIVPTAPPLHIRQVGLVANREWGDDTGTIFSDLRARTRRSEQSTSTEPEHTDLEA